MSELTPDIIAPYIHPDYWGGRMIGQEITDPVNRGFRYGQARYASKVVTSYLEHRRAPYPLVTFSAGEEVDANDYEPGTIFYGNREILNGSGELPQLEITSDEIELPEPPTDTGFTLLDYSEDFKADIQAGISRRFFILVDSTTYTAMRSFIVVTKGRRGKNNLQPVNEYSMYRMPDGKIIDASMSAPIDNPIVIGATRHTRMGKHEQLHRVNTLMLSSEASPSKSISIIDRVAQLGMNSLHQNS